MIKRNHPVRDAFAAKSTGNKGAGYYKSKGHALSAFDEVLHDFSYRLDFECHVDMAGDEGRIRFNILDDSNNEVGTAVFTWYRMPSGNYEFIGYIA